MTAVYKCKCFMPIFSTHAPFKHHPHQHPSLFYNVSPVQQTHNAKHINGSTENSSHRNNSFCPPLSLDGSERHALSGRVRALVQNCPRCSCRPHHSRQLCAVTGECRTLERWSGQMKNCWDVVMTCWILTTTRIKETICMLRKQAFF